MTTPRIASKSVRLFVVAASVALMPVLSPGSYAQDSKAKPMRLVIGFGPGGSYDLYGRAIARYMGAHLPGNPTIVSNSMPAAGSLAATNYIANVAPRDGTVFATVASGAPTAPLMYPEQAKFDARKLTWIGSADNSINIDLVWHTSPVKSLNELRTHEVLVGATGPGATTVDLPLLVNGVLGYKYHLVPGYQSLAEIDLAMERGEVEGESGTSLYTVKTRRMDWWRDGKIRIIAQYGREPLPELPDVPLIQKQARNQEEWQALNLLLARQQMAKPYLAPPEIPPERVKELRKAFMETLADRSFLAEADRLKIEIHSMAGEEIQDLVAELYRTPPAIVERVKALLNQHVQ